MLRTTLLLTLLTASAHAAPCSALGGKRPSVAPAADAEWVWGLGQGSDAVSALNQARTNAAATLEVRIKQQTTDRQVSWSGDKVKEQQEIEQISHSIVQRRLAGCETLYTCESGASYEAFVRCSRRSELDLRLRDIATSVSRGVPNKASVLVLPATDEKGFVTALGEYSSGILRDDLDHHLPDSATLQRSGPWQPMQFDAVSRKYNVSHVVRAEHERIAGSKLRFRAWLVDAKTEQPIRGASQSFELELDPDYMELMRVQGPLFPLKQALDLMEGDGKQEVNVSLGLAGQVGAHDEFQEGDAVELRFVLPKDAYVYVFDIYEDGRAAMLLPNPKFPLKKLKAGIMHKLPDQAWIQADIVIRACPVPGQPESKERVKIIATTSPMQLASERFSGPDMVTLEGGPQGSLVEVVDKLNELKRKHVLAWEGSATYTVITAPPGAKTPCR